MMSLSNHLGQQAHCLQSEQSGQNHHHIAIVEKGLFQFLGLIHSSHLYSLTVYNLLM